MDPHRPSPKKSPSLSRLQLHIQQIGIGGPFRDTPRERRRRARALEYTLGLLLPGERKSMQPSVTRVPDAQYEAIQNFITDSPWDWQESQGRLIDLMGKEVGGPEGILAVDDVSGTANLPESAGTWRPSFGCIPSAARSLARRGPGLSDVARRPNLPCSARCPLPLGCRGKGRRGGVLFATKSGLLFVTRTGLLFMTLYRAERRSGRISPESRRSKRFGKGGCNR